MSSFSRGLMGLVRSSFKATDPSPSLAVGSRFAQMSYTAPVWIVDRLSSSPATGQQHVTLRREDDPLSMKTLAVDVFTSSDEFQEIIQ